MRLEVAILKLSNHNENLGDYLWENTIQLQDKASSFSVKFRW